MNELLCEYIEQLKSALLSLPATGEQGFEGLIGAALREISGVPFRLAASGSQFGVDGMSTYEGDAISFEGKRYDGRVPREQILYKIAELTLNGTNTDIWVLGATSQIPTQLAKDARELGTKNGILVLILDWSDIDLPPFAVALMMGGTRVRDFLTRNISDNETLRKTLAALEVVRNSQDSAPHADRIRAQCNAPTVGWALAQKANTAWLSEAFSSRKRARARLGQPLSPGETDAANTRERKTLIEKLHPYLTAAPDDTVVFIVGGEGCGKSWIVAQSWLALAHKPLMVVMSPEDFDAASGQNDIVEILVAKLIRQTGSEDGAATQARLRRKLSQWRGRPAMDAPRLIVVIDGINQRPKSDWARIINNIGVELNELGGRLVVTARTPYFRDYVIRRLNLPPTEIIVPEWTEYERDEILAEHAIKTSDLHHGVATSLRNPRLLGIALDLLGKDDVTKFEELTVSRLLFEHIRTSERDAPIPQPAHVFAYQLQKHAQEIISRVNAKQQDDVNIFEDDMGAVAEGRFYQPVDGDPTRYSLNDEGLTLALGFAVIDRLRTAQRNGRNLDAELDAILEPIAALDDTADVILAALTVTCVDNSYAQNIAASLVIGFAALQNPDESKFPAFVSQARHRPQGFLHAARTLSLAGGHQSNFDWIQNALLVASRDSRTWSQMTTEVQSWLSIYSLSAERGTLSHAGRDLQGNAHEEIEKKRKKIEMKLNALSATERAMLNYMEQADNDLSELSRLALKLLSGKPLAPFANSLLNWSFSNALNSSYAAPYKDFSHLVSLNRFDWSQTRTALLELSAVLREADVSTTGKWALVNVLRATGHSEDGREAQTLVEDLTKDRPHFQGWRLVEKYCATDPCDPESEQPENLTQTAEQYAAIDVSKLRLFMGQTSEDHFFVMARPGVTRFLPELAIAKHREFAADVLKRVGLPLRQGLLELRGHNALLAIDDAHEIVKKWHDMTSASKADVLDAKMVSDYCLLLAFPFLDATEQTTILLSDEAGEDILLDLIYLVKPLDAAEFESLLEIAVTENNERKQFVLLALAKYASIQLSDGARSQIAALVESESERVRTQVLGVIAQSHDCELLLRVVESDWDASNTKSDGFEAWYGSTALLEAAVQGLVPHNEVLNRISPHLYGRAAALLNTDAVREVVRRIDISINHAAGLKGDLVAPDVELRVDSFPSYEPSRFSVIERPSEANNAVELTRQPSELSESKDAFERHQRRIYDAFTKFKTNLTQEKAPIVLKYLNPEEFEAVVASDDAIVNRWYALFVDIDERKLPIVHNVVLSLAHALAKKAPDRAKKLFRRIENTCPLIRFTFGRAGVQFDEIATWAGVSNPVMDDLRFKRLDRAGTDHDLSIEVLAALLSGQRELLVTYIEAKLRKEEPAEIARGIMVAGFSDQSELNDEILKKYEGSDGLIGSALKAAKYAYERNVWARYWFEKICLTNENSVFWRYAVLFNRIVDGRFDVWGASYVQTGSAIKLFGLAVRCDLKNRFSRWESHRKKTLFGSDAPELIFLEGTGCQRVEPLNSSFTGLRSA